MAEHEYVEGEVNAVLECAECPSKTFDVQLTGDATTWDAQRGCHRWTNVACPSCGTTYTVEYEPEVWP